jgi:hydroxyacylglutathione hydrolase
MTRPKSMLGVLLAVVTLALYAVWRMPELAAWQWRLSRGKPAMNVGLLTLATGLRWADDYYTVADLGEGAFAIGEPRYGQCNFSYLIIGSERALLFDSGPGLHDIRTVVLTLTAQPVIALPSHLHFDHIGDIAKFDDIALPDLPKLRTQLDHGLFFPDFYQFLGFVEGFQRPKFPVARWIAPGSEIDLGGRTLSMFYVPGHTPDSVVLFDYAANRLYAGDFIYPSEIYAFLPGANLSDYAASAARLLERLDDASTIYGAHGCGRLPTVEVPLLKRADMAALQKALVLAGTDGRSVGRGWYPREIPVNGRIRLLAKYPWMRP